jgi:hypothetical protein
VARLKQCRSLLKEILEIKTRNPKSYNCNDAINVALNAKIVSYILFHSNTDHPTDVRIIRETTGTDIVNI